MLDLRFRVGVECRVEREELFVCAQTLVRRSVKDTRTFAQALTGNKKQFLPQDDTYDT